MQLFHKILVGSEFFYNGYTWKKNGPTTARMHGGSEYPFPAHATVTLA